MRKLKKTKVKLLVTLLSFVLLFCGTMGSSLAWLLDSSGPVTNTFTDSDINIELDETTGKNYKMIPGWTIPKDPKVTVEPKSEACYVFVKVEENLGSWTDNKVTKNGQEVEPVFSDYLHYSVLTGDNGWTAGNCICENDTHADDCNKVDKGVYFRIVDSDTAETGSTFYVLTGEVCDIQHSDSDPSNSCTKCANKDGFITVDETVTKEMMDEIDGYDKDGNPVNNETKPTLTFTAAAVQYYKSNNTPFKVEEAYNLVDWTKATNP